MYQADFFSSDPRAFHITLEGGKGSWKRRPSSYFQKMNSKAFLSSLFVCFVLASSVSGKLTIRNVDRVIDLTTQLARHTVSISLLNGGAEPVREFEYAVQNSLAGKLAFISAQEGGSEVRVGEASAATGSNGEKYVTVYLSLSCSFLNSFILSSYHSQSFPLIHPVHFHPSFSIPFTSSSSSNPFY
jgi:hypothetical protein